MKIFTLLAFLLATSAVAADRNWCPEGTSRASEGVQMKSLSAYANAYVVFTRDFVLEPNVGAYRLEDNFYIKDMSIKIATRRTVKAGSPRKIKEFTENGGLDLGRVKLVRYGAFDDMIKLRDFENTLNGWLVFCLSPPTSEDVTYTLPHKDEL